MSINQTQFITDRSRLIATARSLGSLAAESHCFTDKQVLLTGEPHILTTRNGQNCFLNSFRLLLRMVSDLTVSLAGPSDFVMALRAECDRISAGSPPKFVLNRLSSYENFDAILNIGNISAPRLPWTTVNSNGWLARVSSQGENIPADTILNNPVGALAAASLGCSEVFKRLIGLRPQRGELSPARSFSFYTYSLSENPGPALPMEIPIELLLCGAGAIGNGIIHLLDQLAVTGSLAIIDRQAFQPENWGTCLLIGPREMQIPKAEWAASLLQRKLDAVAHTCPIEEFISKCGKTFPYPKLILNGLDNIAARRSIQSLWPDQIIDGAIGPTACEVTIHPWESDTSCLLCDFEEESQSADHLQESATGLRRARLNDIHAAINDDDIAVAPPDKKEWLKLRRGKSICSVVSEAVLATLAATQQTQGFEPSTPFVACLSSCMVVTEMVRHVLNWPRALTTGFQFDSLVGPQNGIQKAHLRNPNCICVQRRQNINRFRVSQHQY